MNLGAKKQILLVWSLVPEETEFYLFESGSEMAILAQKSSGFFINGDNLGAKHEIFKLNELLGHGTYVPVPVSELQGLNIEAVYHAGFFL